MVNVAILEELAQNEEELSRLYNTFSLRFPAAADLWSRLSAQETGHAGLIRGLYPRVNDGSLKLQPERFSRQAIAGMTSYIKELAVKVEEKDLVWAFSVSLDIEKSLIDHAFFNVFEADSQELKLALNKLAEDTRRHFKMIEDARKEFKANL